MFTIICLFCTLDNSLTGVYLHVCVCVCVCMCVGRSVCYTESVSMTNESPWRHRTCSVVSCVVTLDSPLVDGPPKIASTEFTKNDLVGKLSLIRIAQLLQVLHNAQTFGDIGKFFYLYNII